ncbi:MAG: hypothetical protein ABIP80_01070 [Ferruginibacter sp.]
MGISGQQFLSDDQLAATITAHWPQGDLSPSFEAVAVKLFKALTPEAMVEAAALIPLVDSESLRTELACLQRRYSAELFGSAK